MAKFCQNCGKGVMRGNNATRARQELIYRSPKIFKPNLHTARIKQEDGTRVKMLLCTKCLRMMKQLVAQHIASQTATK